MEGQQSPPSEHYVSHKVQRSHVRPPHPTPSGARQSWERGPGPLAPSPPWGSLLCFAPTVPGQDNAGGWTVQRDGPLSALGGFPLLMHPLPPPFAGYQGSFHSIQSCFPYGDCYRTAEPAASGDSLAGEAHGFNPLRPNGYHSLSAPLPATGEPHLHASLPWPPTKAQPCAGYLCTLS